MCQSMILNQPYIHLGPISLPDQTFYLCPKLPLTIQGRICVAAILRTLGKKIASTSTLKQMLGSERRSEKARRNLTHHDHHTMHQDCHLVDLSGGAITSDVFNDDPGSQLVSIPKTSIGTVYSQRL